MPGQSFSPSTKSPKSKIAKGIVIINKILMYIILNTENNCVWFSTGFLL
jgi:hypothetical protein